MTFATLTAAALALALAGAATPEPTPEEAKVAILDYYPTAARAAGVEGQATLACEYTDHFAMRNCRLVSESPANQGFGEAALKLASLSRDNPNISTASIRRLPPQTVFSFRLHPPSILPNTLMLPHIITNPDWRRRPTAGEMASLYPKGAMGVVGRAVIACTVNADGHLDGCKVVEETPAGLGFGDAALHAQAFILMQPQLYDGEPRSGGEIRLPFTFAPRQ